MRKKTRLIWLCLSGLIILIDQFSKYLVDTHLSFNVPVKLLPFLNFILRYNSGAAFSFLSMQGGWQIYLFALLSIIVIIVLLVWLKRLPAKSHWLACSLSLIIGGAIGNLIDRLRLNYVVDFIDFHIGHWHFATFNVADSAVSVGAVMLVWHLLFFSKKPTNTL